MSPTHLTFSQQVKLMWLKGNAPVLIYYKMTMNTSSNVKDAVFKYGPPIAVETKRLDFCGCTASYQLYARGQFVSHCNLYCRTFNQWMLCIKYEIRLSLCVRAMLCINDRRVCNSVFILFCILKCDFIEYIGVVWQMKMSCLHIVSDKMKREYG